MGSSASKPLKVVTVGRANVAAQGIYALFGLKDNIFPYTISLPRKTSGRVILDIRLEKINYEINRKLEKSAIKTKKKVNNALKDDPSVLAHKNVSSGKKLETVYYNSRDHGDHLILCKENIFEINNCLDELNNLVLLQLCCNYINRIPPSINKLQKLNTLSLARNQLRYLPEEICELKNLSHLDLSYNFLTELPQNIKNLESLNSLHLEHNVFTEMPIEISKLKSLRHLKFNNNLIKDVPLQILRMPFLIDFNGITTTFVYENIFKEVGKLDLVEMCLRNIVKNTLSIYKKIDRSLIEQLLNLEECGFCGGPIFNAYFLVKTSEYFEAQLYPVKYKICKKHFRNQKNRISALFSKTHNTIPYNILVNHKISVKDIFNPSIKIKKRHKVHGFFSKKMHLWSLAKLNNLHTKKKLFKKIDQIFFE